MLSDDLIRKLIGCALSAREAAYTPYSHYRVGAALMGSDGRIYTGCNIENAAFSPSNCAERTVFFKAISEGEREFKAIAVVAGPEGCPPQSIAAPCGVCRQVMMEFCDPESFIVIMAVSEEDYSVMTLDKLLPLAFGPDNLRAP